MIAKKNSQNEMRKFKIARQATALTIAGSDPSGGAGLQADLKTFHHFGVYGMSVVTMITVQNTLGVHRVEILPASLIGEQIDAVVNDIPPRVVKLGALGNQENVEVVAAKAKQFSVPIVVDPVMVSKHGHSLMDDQTVETFKKHILPLAYLITPNRFEAKRLTGESLDTPESIERSIHALRGMGARYVLLKLSNDDSDARLMLGCEDRCVSFRIRAVDTDQTHGSGCVLSAAIASRLILGDDMPKAVEHAFRATVQAIGLAPKLGHGRGPIEMRALDID